MKSISSARRKPTTRPELSADQKAEIREAFTLFDLDRDERVDYHELKVGEKANISNAQ